MHSLSSRVEALEKKLKPEGRHFYVWKDSEAHRQAEAQWKPGDVIHIIRWIERDPEPAGAQDEQSTGETTGCSGDLASSPWRAFKGNT